MSVSPIESNAVIEPSKPVSWLKFPWLLLWALPALSVIGGVSMLIIAIRHGDSMVKDDYYRQGLAYNTQQQADRAAAKHHLQAALVTVNQQLLLTLSAEQLPELPEQLELHLSHPTEQAADQRLLLQRQSAQQYLLTSLPDIRTNWYLQLQPADGSWRLRGRWQPPEPALLKPEVY